MKPKHQRPIALNVNFTLFGFGIHGETGRSNFAEYIVDTKIPNSAAHWQSVIQAKLEPLLYPCKNKLAIEIEDHEEGIYF